MTAPLYSPPADGRLLVRHPLATRHGIELLGLVLAAGEHWRSLTRVQRSTLRRAVRAALDDLDPGGQLPELPADTHPATRRSLERRGLAADGRLTALAVDVVAHAVDRRPVRTAITTGDLL